MSEKIKARTLNIYSHLMKTMNNHYTAGGIASEAQRYLDRGVKTDDTTEHNATAHSNKLQRPKRPKAALEQQSTANNQVPQWKTQIKKNTSLTNRSTSNQTHRDKAQSQAICRNYVGGFNCLHPPLLPKIHALQSNTVRSA